MPALQVKVTLEEPKVDPGGGVSITAGLVPGVGVGVAVGVGVGVGVGLLNRPKAPTPLVVPTYTLPLAIVGVTNLLLVPN